MKKLIPILVLTFAAMFTHGAGVPLYSVNASNAPVHNSFYVIAISMDGTNIVRTRFDQFTSSNLFVTATQALHQQITNEIARSDATNGALRSLIQTSFDTQAMQYAVGVWTTSQVSLLQIRLDNIEAITNLITGASGTVTNGTNVGSGAVTIFDVVNGGKLEFNTFNLAGPATLASNANTFTITITAPSETDASNLAFSVSQTLGVQITNALSSKSPYASTTAGSNAIPNLDGWGTNTHLLSPTFGSNTNIILIISNSSATGPGVAHWFRTTNGTITGTPYMSVNLTNGNVGISTVTPTNALDVAGSISTGSILVSNVITRGVLFLGSRTGNAVLVGGTVTVSLASITENSVVMLTRKTSGGTLGTTFTYTLSAGTSFTINSDSALDTSTFSYAVFEP